MIPASPPVISCVKHNTLHVCIKYEIQDRCGWLKAADFVSSGGLGLFRLSGLLIGCFTLDDSKAQTQQQLVTEECRGVIMLEKLPGSIDSGCST